MADGVRLLATLGAFWLALLLFRRATRACHGSARLRFIAGLALGVAFARAAWGLIDRDLGALDPYVLLGPSAGVTLFAVPLGPLVVSARELARGHDALPAATFGSLPLAFALARVGCVAAGCCAGVPLPGIGARLPHALEIAGFVGLHFVLRAVPESARVPFALVGFGIVRVCSAIARADVGQADVLTAGAFAWIGLGLLLGAWRGRRSRRRPGEGPAPTGAGQTRAGRSSRLPSSSSSRAAARSPEAVP